MCCSFFITVKNMNVARVVSVVLALAIFIVLVIFLVIACVPSFRGCWPCFRADGWRFWGLAVVQAMVLGQLVAAFVYFAQCLWDDCAVVIGNENRYETWLVVWVIATVIALVPCSRNHEYGMVWRRGSADEEAVLEPLTQREPSSENHRIPCGLLVTPTRAFGVGGVLRGLPLLFLMIGESSFAGSAGTQYYLDKKGTVRIGLLLFWYLFVAAILSGLLNIVRIFLGPKALGSVDLTSTMLYGFAASAVASYGRFISLDYVEAGVTDPNVQTMWGVLQSISTLGNEPRSTVPAEAISWALVEMFAYLLVLLDTTYCLRCALL